MERSPAKRPDPRLIRTPEDAEEAAAIWLQYFGFTDARVTNAGADGGVDVESGAVVAQVKAEMKPTGRPVVQQIYGIATLRRTKAAVFSLGGFTNEALEWANDAGVSLFSFDLQGEPVAENPTATRLQVGRRNMRSWLKPKLDELLAALGDAEKEYSRPAIDESVREIWASLAELSAYGVKANLGIKVVLSLLEAPPSLRRPTQEEMERIQDAMVSGDLPIDFLSAYGPWVSRTDIVLLGEHCRYGLARVDKELVERSSRYTYTIVEDSSVDILRLARGH